MGINIDDFLLDKIKWVFKIELWSEVIRGL